MEDGQVILYDARGEPLWRFHAYKAYRVSGRMGFLSPSFRREEDDDSLRDVSLAEGPIRTGEPDEADETVWLEGPEEGATEDEQCFRPT